MGLMTRFIRLCKSDIHGVMDQLEEKGLMLRQHLREMEKALGEKGARLDALKRSREHVLIDLNAYDKEIEKLEKDLRVALDKDRDDIARFIIKKLKPLSEHREDMARREEALGREADVMEEWIRGRQLEYDKIKLKSEVYFSQRDDRFAPGLEAPPNGSEMSEQEVELELMRRKEGGKKEGLK